MCIRDRLSGNTVETVTALFDYEAQAEGDLSFSTGEVIEIVTRTDNPNEWWIGKIGVRQGQFPGKFDFRNFLPLDMLMSCAQVIMFR